MPHLLLVLVPLGLAAAVSPVMVTEQTVLLAGPQGRRAGLLFAAGTSAVLMTLVGATLLAGASLSLPTAPHLDASLDLVIGGLLLALAGLLGLWHRRGRESRPRSHERMSPPAAFAFGAFSMATNVTTLALVLPGAKEIAASHVPAWGGLAAVVLLVALADLPAWGPVALESAAPTTAHTLLTRLDRLIQRRGRVLVALLLAAAGAFLVTRGVLRLVGL